MDLASLGAGFLGATIGSSIAVALAGPGLTAALTLGPFAFVPVAGVIGRSLLAHKLLAWWRSGGASSSILGIPLRGAGRVRLPAVAPR